MIFKLLKIKGFKSFISEQSLDFSKLSSKGFYFITGKNNVNPELDANGVGKSSLLDAICFVLYGKTLTGLKAGNISNWSNTEKCQVSLTINTDNKDVEICRTWNPNNLTIDNKIISQEALEQFLGIDYVAFTYSVLIGQFNQKFFDLMPSEKLQVFTELLNLDKWLNYSQCAKDLSKRYNEEIQSKEKDLSYLEGKINSFKTIDYKEKLDQWNLRYKDKLIDLDKSILDLQEQFNIKSEHLKSLEKPILDLQTFEIALMDELPIANQNYSDFKSRIASKQTEQKFLNGKLQEVKNKITSFSKLSGQVCVVCQQNITSEHVDKCVKLLEKDSQGVEKELLEIKKVLLGFYSKEEQSKKILEDLNQEILSTKKHLNDLVKEQQNLQSNLKWIEVSLEKAEKELLSAQDEKNPYQELYDKNKYSINVLSRSSMYKNEDIQEDRRQKSIFTFWEKGFKDIRLMVVEDVLKEFEIHINTNLNKLGLNGWGVSLAIDSETKSGTSKKGFTVLVKSPFNTELVPFECWSGGEGQRLRLAGTLALIDLINSKTGINSSIEFLDEPTQWLSDSGIDDLLYILKQRSLEKNKQIFIIDHRDFNTFGDFNGTIQIIKNHKGSEILQEN